MKRIVPVFFLIIAMSFSVYTQGYKTLEEAITKVAFQVGKSVVSIVAVVKEKPGQKFYFGSPFGGSGDDFSRFFEEFFGEIPEKFGRTALGSGFIIDKDGYILTNSHVVSGAKEITVTLSDGREFSAVLKGKDARTDLAVIKINAKGLFPVKLGDSDDLKIGRFVFALGNPFGISTEYQNPEPTLTMGVISALHRYLPTIGGRSSLEDLIQTDAAINPGNSGGPLVNLNGEVIGVNVAIITRSGGYEGIGFAIPVNRAKRILSQLIKGEKVLYGWLGVSIQDLNQDLRNYFGIKEKEGVIVVKLFKDSPADKAGIKEGDLILSLDARPVSNTRNLVSLVTSAEVGKTSSVRVLRGGKEITLDIKIGPRPEDIAKIETVEIIGFRGMEVEDLTSYLRKRFRIREKEGVIVVNIKEDSPADKAGLNMGDLIIRIGDNRVKNKEDFEKAVLNISGNCLVKTNRGYFVLKEE